ncbi:MAG: quinone oxidoreductase [Chloroflexi bacterium]|uniref:Quinone oxidoreductase n=1 Tax=Candidatus Chlorohelix allophototropha TaxID=3003348 RepID=A0A8T7M043_9CHLR|nr:quinone oxidoreductase [Chloroflexota bacterium]WJW67125.1 quinone oxidoreductase [Chloroflexota bacterium L227-S17]
MYAIQIETFGGPEVLNYKAVPNPTPKAGEALIKLAASGINFIDVYHRTGRYPNNLPLIPGQEGAGVVEAVGEGVTEFKVGDRVAYTNVPGSYAEYAAVPASKLVPVPTGMDFRYAAAAMLQGMTAHYLCHTTYPVKEGDSVLVHAGAGGVGLLLIQMCKMLGAQVFTTVSTEEKAVLAKEAGADEVILYNSQDFEAEIKRLTGGVGVEVVYDAVGKTTFDKSLNSLKQFGYLVLYGASSGAVPPIDPIILMRGSYFLTRPTLGHYIADRTVLLSRAGDVLNWTQAGKLKLRVEHTYPLSQAAQAHIDLEGRATTGKLVLIPGS